MTNTEAMAHLMKTTSTETHLRALAALMGKENRTEAEQHAARETFLELRDRGVLASA